MKKSWMISLGLLISFSSYANERLKYELKDEFHSDFRKTPKLIFTDTDSFVKKNKKSQSIPHLEELSRRIGVPAKNLKLYKVKESLLGKHYYFQQEMNGYRIAGAEVILSIDPASGKVLRVFNNTYPEKNNFQKGLMGKQHIPATEAYDIAWKDLRVSGELLELPKAEKKVHVDGKGFQIVYVLRLSVSEPFGYWEYMVNAITGDIISKRDRRWTRKAVKREKRQVSDSELVSFQSALKSWNKEQQKIKQSQFKKNFRKKASGQGLVFDPDPRTTLRNNQLEDKSPATDFEAAYFSRELKDLTEKDGVFHLVGPWIQLKDFESPKVAPSTSANGQWDAKRGNVAFNDVMTYYHIDKNQRYMQSLGFKGNKGIQEVSIEVDANGVNGTDNSHFIPSSNRMAFGHGCVDDNEDADVILHEYGHAINFSINSNWSGGDTGAMGEGFGDYWAASYSLSTENGEFKKNVVFNWDGGGCWDGRRLDRMNARYDHSKNYGAHSRIEGGIQSDELWSTPLFQAHLKLLELGEPRENVDRIVLEAQFGLGSGLKMRDMAQAIIQVAEQMYPNRPYRQAFVDSFHHHGIIELPAAKFSVDNILITHRLQFDPVNPGDSINVLTKLKNDGTSDASVVQGALSSSQDGISILENRSGFGNIEMGKISEAQKPFVLKVKEDFQCGKDIHLSMNLNWSGGAVENQSLALKVPTGVKKNLVAEGVVAEGGEAIPDNKGSLEKVVSVQSAEVLKGLKVKVDIEHTYIGDLTVDLISPAGTKVELHARSGGGKDNLQGVFPDTLNPKGSLSRLRGENLQGEWKLVVADKASQDTGRLIGWSLDFLIGHECE